MLEVNKNGSETGIGDILKTFWKGKITIIAVTIGVVSMVGLYQFVAVPKYSAKAMLMVKRLDPAQGMEQMVGPQNSLTGISMETDVELLKSYPLAEATVRLLANSDMKSKLELFGNRPVKGLFSDNKAGAKALTDSVVTDKNLRNYARDLQSRITVENERGTNLMKVTVSSPYPDEAALLVNTLCTAYKTKDIEWNASHEISVENEVSKQLEQQKEKVVAVENDLAKYMQDEGIYEATGNVVDQMKKLGDVESRYNENRTEYNILSKRLGFVRQQLSADESALSSNISQSIANQLRAVQDKIKAQESAYVKLAMNKNADDPELKASRDQLYFARSQYEQITKKKIAGELASAASKQKYRFDLISEQLQTDIKLADLDNSAKEYLTLKNKYQGELSQLPKKQLTFAQLSLDLDVAKKTYAFLKEKLDEARVKVSSKVGRIFVLEAAYAPSSQESPDLMKNLLIGIVVGLGLGGTIVYSGDKFRSQS
jgi:succinoglycan biosynthesis transport protein ExoP